MIEPQPTWDLYRTFLEVAKGGSLSGAARRLGLTQPTAGRHIDALENVLGVVLFTRSQSGMLPTPAALELMPHAETMASAEAALRRTASGGAIDASGVVRITASQVISCEVLPPMLAAFCALHPAIAVELSVSNALQDLSRRDADIAIRTTRPRQTALVARRIGAIRIGLFAHRAYIERRGVPNKLEDLSEHCLIGFDRDATSYRSVGGLSARLKRSDFGFRCDDDTAQIAAIRSGIGIGGCHLRIGETTADLVPILPGVVSFKLDVWLAMHKDLRTTRRVRLMFDHLAGTLGRYVRGS